MKILIIAIIPIFCNCYYTMGMFRNASTLGTNNYELSTSGVYNGWDAIGTLRARYGLTKYIDLELTSLGAIALMNNNVKYYGFGYSATYELPFFDYVAVGFQGGYSNYRNGIGPRIIFGYPLYVGFEENYLFSTKDSWIEDSKARFTENLFFGIQWKRIMCLEWGCSTNPFLGTSFHLGLKWNFLTK